MRKVERGEILPIAEYETIRDRFRARVIEHKKSRRVALGPHMSAVFENRDTVLMQIQEMLRTERITREDAVLHEIETYNDLVPGKDELSATVFIEILDKELRDRTLVELAGLEPCFALEVDGRRLPGRNETRGVLPDRTTAVHYVKLPLDAPAATALREKQGTWALVVDHPGYQARAPLAGATLASLSGDLYE